MRKSIEHQLDVLDHELKLLMKELKRFDNKDLNWKPKADKWSVLQVVQHLMRSEDLSLKYVQKKLSFNPVLKRAGIGNFFRILLLKIYLRSPFKRKAPAIVNEESFPEVASFWDLAKQWNAQRATLKSFLSSLPDATFKKAVYKHPLAGRLTLEGMLIFHIEHIRRHRKQILNLLSNFKY
jgi:DinB superfamily